MARSRQLSWRLLRLHLTLIACVCGFALLADWQFHRALAGNGLSWAYAFEWPLFIVYAFVLWRRLVLDEIGAPARRLRRRPSPASFDRRARRELANAARNDVEDQERERYNAYLAELGNRPTGHRHIVDGRVSKGQK